MKSKILSLFLIIFTVCALSAVAYGAELTGTEPYHGDLLIAVNTNFSTASSVSGTFTSADVTDGLSATVNYSLSGHEAEEPVGLCQFFDLPEPVGTVPPSLYASFDTVATEYSVGDTRTIADQYRAPRPVQCLYVGEYCTVWGATADDVAIQINAENAKTIADAFDASCQATVAAFGNWHDVNGDGKIAIFCYDIDSEYATNSRPNSYTAGFFNAADMMNASDRVNGILFLPTGSNNGNHVDCIHVDTYPAMGSIGNELTKLDNVFPTLIHEFQHLIAFSHRIESGIAKDAFTMPSFLNEAFSLAAEHVILGADSCNDRVAHFNSTRYAPGHSLTYWSSSLSNYANSYLFGQYLRIRHGQNGKVGSTVYKAIFEALKAAPESDALDIAAATLNTTPYDLITDFWAAVFANQPTGKYGFNGESWADTLAPRIQSVASLGSYSTAVKSGGAVAFRPGDAGFIPKEKKKIAFIAVDNGTVTKDQPITVTKASSPNGSFSIPAFFVYGEAFQFSQKANTGYYFDGFLVNGVRSGKVAFKVTEPISIGAVFTQSGQSGTCGDSVTWALTDKDENGTYETLTISGSGSMANYSYANTDYRPTPWFAYKSDITEASFSPGVTSVGAFSFFGHQNLKTANLAKSNILTLQDNAFRNCTSLESVTLPETIRYLREFAFYGCSSLECIHLPDELAALGNSAFYGCTALQSVNIPSSIDMIAESTFYGCSSLKAITLPENITSIGSDVFYGCSSLAHVTIPKGQQIIYRGTFYGCSSLESVTIPSGVTTIGEAAFHGCSNLQKIYLPHSLQMVCPAAFHNCSSLTEAHYPGTQEGWNAITVQNSNTALKNALILDCAEIREAETESTITVSVTQYTAGSAIACLALYGEDGRLIGFDYATLTKDQNGTLTADFTELDEAVASWKVILADPSQGLLPLMRAPEHNR